MHCRSLNNHNIISPALLLLSFCSPPALLLLSSCSPPALLLLMVMEHYYAALLWIIMRIREEGSWKLEVGSRQAREDALPFAQQS